MHITKTATALFALIIYGTMLNAIPPGPGSQHIRISGTEVLEVLPTPGWTSFTSKQTLDIPSLQVKGLVLYMEFTGGMEQLMVPPFGAFRGWGTATLYLEGSTDPVGMVAGTYYGENASSPPEIAYTGKTTLAGVIWAGPMAGMVITENLFMEGLMVITPEGIPVAAEYIAYIDGFLMAPDYVDVKAAKAALKD